MKIPADRPKLRRAVRRWRPPSTPANSPSPLPISARPRLDDGLGGELRRRLEQPGETGRRAEDGRRARAKCSSSSATCRRAFTPCRSCTTRTTTTSSTPTSSAFPRGLWLQQQPQRDAPRELSKRRGSNWQGGRRHHHPTALRCAMQRRSFMHGLLLARSRRAAHPGLCAPRRALSLARKRSPRASRASHGSSGWKTVGVESLGPTAGDHRRALAR